MDGILLVDKPKGWTSFDVVGYIRRMIKNSEYNVTNKKLYPLGHTGTLDPFATGLLVILIGKYTKRAQELTKLDKTYEVTMKLGEVSSTGDPEGEITAVSNNIPSLDAVTKALEQFKGEIMQTPPIYSAIKVNGQRAYKLAREGKVVTLEARPATIHDIRDVAYKYPIITFTVGVSSGTYIRTLVEDIAKVLGTGAYTTELRRTHVGQFSLQNAHDVKTLSPDYINDHVATL